MMDFDGVCWDCGHAAKWHLGPGPCQFHAGGGKTGRPHGRCVCPGYFDCETQARTNSPAPIPAAIPAQGEWGVTAILRRFATQDAAKREALLSAQRSDGVNVFVVQIVDECASSILAEKEAG